MKWSWKLGRIFGIDVFVHATFLLLIGWIVITHSLSEHSLAATVACVVFILALFGSVLLHEFGHALAARRFGIQTRDITILPRSRCFAIALLAAIGFFSVTARRATDADGTEIAIPRDPAVIDLRSAQHLHGGGAAAGITARRCGRPACPSTAISSGPAPSRPGRPRKPHGNFSSAAGGRRPSWRATT